MQPGNYDFTVEGGDCLPLRVILKDENGSEIALAGYTSRFYAAWNGGSITLDSATDGLDITDQDSPSVGGISGELSGTQTGQLPFGRLTTYEWSVTQPDGCILTFMTGYIIRL